MSDGADTVDVTDDDAAEHSSVSIVDAGSISEGRMVPRRRPPP